MSNVYLPLYISYGAQAYYVFLPNSHSGPLKVGTVLIPIL